MATPHSCRSDPNEIFRISTPFDRFENLNFRLKHLISQRHNRPPPMLHSRMFISLLRKKIHRDTIERNLLHSVNHLRNFTDRRHIKLRRRKNHLLANHRTLNIIARQRIKIFRNIIAEYIDRKKQCQYQHILQLIHKRPS